MPTGRQMQANNPINRVTAELEEKCTGSPELMNIMDQSHDQPDFVTLFAMVVK